MPFRLYLFTFISKSFAFIIWRQHSLSACDFLKKVLLMKNSDLQTYFLPFSREFSTRCFWVFHPASPFHVQPIFLLFFPFWYSGHYIFLHFYYLFYMLGVLPVCMSVSYICLQRPEEDIGSAGAGVIATVNCHGCWELNPSPGRATSARNHGAIYLVPGSLYFSLALSTTWWFTKSPSYFAKYDKLASYF